MTTKFNVRTEDGEGGDDSSPRLLSERLERFISENGTLREQRKVIDQTSRNLRIRNSLVHGRASENEISKAVIRFLANQVDGKASLSDIYQELPNFVVLNSEDLKTSLTRPSEPLWTQQVRNIISHRFTDGNAISEGLLRYEAPGILSISDAGRDVAAELDSALDDH